MLQELSDEQWQQIADYCSPPCSLKDANLSLGGFLYDREYGFFHVDFGMHNFLAAKLYSFRNNISKKIMTVDEKHELADKWLECKGSCFLSNVGDCYLQVWNKDSLNAQERLKFKKFRCEFLEEER